MTFRKFSYAIEGLIGRLGQAPRCPACKNAPKGAVDKKYFHQLLECSECGLLFRYPCETMEKMNRFYQASYQQSGLTTDLPDGGALAQLLETNFSGTSKDFSRFLDLFNALKVSRGASLLDFGANWGYGMYQFEKAGLSTSGYEISAPRAAFGRKLGLNIATDWSDVRSDSCFDVAFSAHVLEHTPDPAEAIRNQIAVLKPGGHLVAVFPNGSLGYREADFDGFHRLWGLVHPVLPTVEFLDYVLPTSSWFVGAITEVDLGKISDWDGTTPTCGDTTRSELLVIYRV